MYFIQGADQKEYGPITAEQLRQWIGENRLNRTSLARKDGDPTWRPLSDFPEFTDAFGAAPPVVTVPFSRTSYGSPAASADVDGLVKPPAIAILVSSILGGLLAAAGVVMNLMGVGGNQQTPPGMPPEFEKFFTTYLEFAQKFGTLSNILIIVTSVISIVAAVRMMQLRSYGLVMTGVILAMIPCLSGCCCLGLPFGIWAIVVLSKPEVKSAFH